MNYLEVRTHILIVGLGSIGKVHLEHSLGIADLVSVVDPNLEVAKYLESHFDRNKICYYSTIQEIHQVPAINLAVIANWGPDHTTSFHELVELGVNFFIIEKPLASKIEDLEELKAVIARGKIKVICNLTWSYSHFMQQLERITKIYSLGPVRNILVSGGAKCLVTNGIHYLALAIQIFGSEATEVTALTYNSPINPRASRFLFLAGSAIWEFPDDRYLNISFSNESHLQLSAILIFSRGKLVIEGNQASLFKISDENTFKIDKPTRTYLATEPIEQFSAFIDSLGNDGLVNIYEKFINAEPWGDLELGIQATEAILGMLIADSSKMSTTLPLNQTDLNKYRFHDWMIS